MELKRRRVKEEGDPIIQATAQVSRYTRDLQPGSYLLRIKSFSVLAESNIEKYKSSEFEAGGYKWELYLYPNGTKGANISNNYISLYLGISDTSKLPQGWEVNAQFKFFVYDHIKDKYLTIEDIGGSIKRFHAMKTEWGVDQLLPLDLFRNTSNGYLFEDSCVFGAEILVIKCAGLGQCLEMKKETADRNTYTWKIEKISAIKENVLEKKFRIGDIWWKLVVYPKGMNEYKDQCISIFLNMADSSEFVARKTRIYAEYKLGILSQVPSINSEKRSATYWFQDSLAYGFPNFMSLSDLNDKSKGYIVNDTLFIQAEITITGVAKNRIS